MPTRHMSASLVAVLLCSLAASGFAQTADANAAQPASAMRGVHPPSSKHKYHHPDPCMEGLPDHYKARTTSAQRGSSHCDHSKYEEQPDYQGRHHNKPRGDEYDSDGYEGKHHDEYYPSYRNQCPAGPVPIRYQNLLRSNDSYPSGTWGMQIDKQDRAIWRLLPEAARAAYAAAPANAGGYTLPADSGFGKFKAYSVNPDFPSLHIRGNKAFMINHFEAGQPGTMYKTTISKDEDGRLTVRDTENIDLSKIGSIWFACSGTITPWDSHMGSEEYPADCRLYEKTLEDALRCTAANRLPGGDLSACGWITGNSFESNNALSLIRYFGQNLHPITDQDKVTPAERNTPVIQAFESAMGLASTEVLEQFREKFNCYNYCGSPEVSINFDGDTHVTKWWTLGLVAHESALVMPDLRTVYTTDDGTNCGFFMFKADKKADLSCGTLYAARLESVGEVTASQANFAVRWIKLGYATQDELEAVVAKKPKFSDIFDVAAPITTTSPYSCPPRYSAANTPGYKSVGDVLIECLKVKDGMETVAAFLETRRYAAMLRATTEFEKEEGITYDADRNKLYVAYAAIDRGMTNDVKYSYGVAGHIAMPINKCGAIFSYDVNDDNVAISASAILYGNRVVEVGDNTCDVNAIANPDNIHYFNNVLFIGEDSSNHYTNLMWAYNLQTSSLTRIMSAPRFAEITGHWLTYWGEHAYLTVAMQHPEDKSESNLPLDLPTATITVATLE